MLGFRDNEQHDFDEKDAFEDLLHSQLRAVVPIDGPSAYAIIAKHR